MQAPAVSAQQSAVPVPQKQSSSSVGLAVGVTIGVVAFLLLKAVLIYFFCRWRRKRGRLNAKLSGSRSRCYSSKRAEELWQHLREMEFASYHIEICLDAQGNKIELGHGGFGRVVKGIRDGVQPVAVKVMLDTDQQAQEDFLKEIKMLKHLSRDANIVQYFGASFQDDQLWLVTEFMEGGDLRRALSSDDSQNRITWWNGGKQIAIDTAKGLVFLHSQRVIHRDIKSQNILLTKERRAKIADVGMAKIMSSNYYATSLNKQRGTLAWASPELIYNKDQCSEKADIYSFGVCLWEIVTAQIPIRGDIFTPTSGECPEEVARLIKDCMQQHPADRPSAPEIYRRLEMCEPFSFEDGGQVILDSAEDGGRSGRVSAQHEAARKHSPVASGKHARGSYSYDSPMSTYQGFKGSPTQKQSIPGHFPSPPLPTSNAAFAQLTAKFTQTGMSTPVTTHPDDIMASSSVDADLNHIPSIHDSAMLGRTGLPDLVLTINDGRYLDFTQTQSSSDLVATDAGCLTISLPTLGDRLHSGELPVDCGAAGFATGDFATEDYTSDHDGSLLSGSEDNDTVAVAVASVQGYAGSSHAESRLNTGTHTSDAGSVCGDEDSGSKETEAAAREPELPTVIERLPVRSSGSRPGGPHPAGNEIHTGSTVYEDAEDQAAWCEP